MGVLCNPYGKPRGGHLAATIVRFARRENGLANWPAAVDSPSLLVQWFHGAPGVITSLAPRILPGVDETLDAVLLEGGELVWRAGPLTKGPSLCHGTASNGYALLALHTRTGDPVWLDRAWQFAGHAVAQSRALQQAHGMPRTTLWTGDVGVACFVRACAAVDPRWPTLEVL